MEEHTTTERAGCPWGIQGISISGRVRSIHSNSPSVGASTVVGGGVSGDKLECHKFQGWERAHSVCQGEGLALTRPLPMCLEHPRSDSCYLGFKWEQRQRQAAQQSGQGQSHTARGSAFLVTMGLSTHPVASRIPLSASPASVPKRSMDLTVGEQASWVGSEALQQTQQVSSLLRKPCCLAGNKNLDCRQCLPGR